MNYEALYKDSVVYGFLLGALLTFFLGMWRSR